MDESSAYISRFNAYLTPECLAVVDNGNKTIWPMPKEVITPIALYSDVLRLIDIAENRSFQNVRLIEYFCHITSPDYLPLIIPPNQIDANRGKITPVE